MSFIKIDRLSKHFGAVAAVDNVSIDIARGEFFSLLGPSGCGKTTLLRMIAGFEFPDSGNIFIDDVGMTDLPPNRRPSNMVFQSYAIFPHLNVFDNIAYGLRRDRLSRAALETRVHEALAVVKLPDFGARKPHQLSGGQRQRVALARALIRKPKVLLLDEPLGALDRRLREAMQFELRQLQKNIGITFIFVTHDQEEALAMSDRVAVMSGGRILQVAAPRALYEQPNCREVADFIGEMNFLDAAVLRNNSGMLEVDVEAIGRLRLREFPDVPAGSKILLALRPEKIALSREPFGDFSVQGTLSGIAYLGERSHYNVQVGSRSLPVSVSAQNRGLAADLVQGDTVFLSWDMGAMNMLNA